MVTDNQGKVTQTLDYYPYGKKRINTGIDKSSREYIGQVTDHETNLSYLNARYMDSTRGQFTSQDPMFWTLPMELLADPQQLNSYSYARNNPIVGSDPNGLRTIVVPGTFNDSKDSNPKIWSENGKAADFLNRVSETFGEKAEIFKWSGGNSVDARQKAASELAAMINDHSFTESEKLNIIGHSHGGNVGILASRLIDRQVDNLVTLGTPVRTVYQPFSNVSNHINIYSRFDKVQRAGEVGDPLTITGIDPRQYSGADNVGVGLKAGIKPVESHSNLWQNKSVWSLVDTRIGHSSW